MKPSDFEIALACREGVRRALGVDLKERSCERVERRTRTMRRSGRGGDGTRDDAAVSNLYGLKGLAANDYLMTANPGGEAGTATGFIEFALVRIDSLTTGNQGLTTRQGTNSGWALYIDTSQQLTAIAYDGTGTLKTAPVRKLLASDVGRIFLVAMQHTGSSVRAWCDRVATGSTSITGFTSASGAHSIGTVNNATVNAATGCTVLGAASFLGVPTDAQIQAYYDGVRGSGALLDTLTGATQSHLWSVRRELANVPDPTGRITYGARAFSGTSNLQTVAGAGIGSASGFWAAVAVRVDQQLSLNEFIVSNYVANNGWYLQYTSSNSIRCVVQSAGTNTVSSSIAVSASDVGHPLLILIHYTGTAIRLYIKRAQVGADVTGAYTNGGGTTAIGMPTLTWYFTQGSVFGFEGGNWSPTLAEIQQCFDDFDATGQVQPIAGKTDHRWDLSAAIVANGGAMPASIPNTATPSVPLTLSGTLEVAKVVATAPAAPLQLTDRITGASADALARVGMPVVAKIDPSIDGRITYGAQGFSAANYLQTAGGKGIRGAATGFYVQTRWRIDNTSTSDTHYLVSTYNSVTGKQGFILEQAGVFLQCRVWNGTTTAVVSSKYTVVTGDLGRTLIQTAVLDASGNLHLYIDGVEQGSGVAVTGGYAPNTDLTQSMLIGVYQGPNFAGGSFSVFEVGGGNFVPTLADLAAQVAASQAAGQLVQLSGATDHFYNITQDVVASGDLTTVPTTILDRVGTDHMTRVGIDVHTDANAIRSVGPYGASDGWQTAAGSGIQGSNTFWVQVDLWLLAITASPQDAAGCAPSGLTTGWSLRLSGAGQMFGILGATTQVLTSLYTLSSGDLNKRLRVVLNKTSTVWQMWINGAQVGADVSATTFNANAANAVGMTIGQLSGARNFANGYVEMVQGGSGASLTTGEIATLFADLTTAAPSVSGKTDKRYVFETDIAAVGGKLPSRSIERISGGDDMVRSGSGLTLAQKIERLYAWESAPVMKASLGPTSADQWQRYGLDMAGDAVGFFVGILVRYNSTTSTGRMVANSVGAAGWYWNGQTNFLQFSAPDATSLKSAPTISTTADGKARPVLGVFDIPGGYIRTYANRAQVGSGTAIAGYNTSGLSAIGMAIGGFIGGGSFNPSWDVLGVVMGYGVPSLAEFRAWEDACLVTEDIAILGGIKTAHMYSTKRSISGNQMLDLVGTSHLSKAGSPQIVDIYSHAFAL